MAHQHQVDKIVWYWDYGQQRHLWWVICTLDCFCLQPIGAPI